MKSRIQEVIPTYSKYECILPEEVEKLDLKNELVAAKMQLDQILEEDVRNIDSLLAKENKTYRFGSFSAAESIIKAGFTRKDETTQDKGMLYFSHWIMSHETLHMLSNNVLEIASELIRYYQGYVRGEPEYDRKGYYVRYSRTYMDFYGYLINIRETVTEYYDRYVDACNIIDPTNKESRIIAYQSATSPEEYLSAVKELLLLGNFGRLGGFPLLRAVIETYVTRDLFNLKNSNKFANKEVVFKNKNNDITSINAICNSIDRLGYGNEFGTDSIRRLYNWESIAMHQGLRANEYVTWYLLLHTGTSIMDSFSNNFEKTNNKSEKYRDEILEDLKKHRAIDFK